jgi:PIN domain nuclease of toxin-antitoxin system
MRILIDTHTFLWFFSDPSKIPLTSRDLIELKSSVTLISVVSVWEMSIKSSAAKLHVSGGFQSIEQTLLNNDIHLLPLGIGHTVVHHDLPFHHKDPFDRMIAAQAISEGINLISIDESFDPYFRNTNVTRIW